MIEDEYAEALDEAELEFVERLAKEIEAGELEGVEHWRAFHERLGADHHERTTEPEGAE